MGTVAQPTGIGCIPNIYLHSFAVGCTPAIPFCKIQEDISYLADES